MSTDIIEVDHLFKTYRDTRAVDDLSFRIEGPGCFAFLGPNGAGKTTTMKVLYGKAQPDRNASTRLSVFGYDPRRSELNIKALAGVAPQDDNLDQELNVLQNLQIYSKFYGLAASQAADRIDYLLEFMELAERRTARVRELSGGMKRRLIIARALLGNPRLLILDEPTTGLDPQVRQLIWNKLRNLIKTGVTILLTTHYMEEAYQIADTIVIMDKGKKVLEGAPRRLLSDNIEAYVLELNRPERKDELIAMVKPNGHPEIRVEDSGERVLYYAGNISHLEDLGSHLAPDEFLVRPSNLEDLFLRITGRRLNDAQ